MQERTGRFLKVLNNNAALVDVAGARHIVVGRGVGFKKQLGDVVDLSVVTEVFSPSSPAELHQLTEFAREIPLEVFDVARRAVDHAQEEGQVRASQALLLSVADHLHFAVQRARNGTRMDFPLKWEIVQLYPVEAELGRQTVGFANEVLEVRLPDDEATAFAMHFVNAQFARADAATTVAMTELLQRVVDAATVDLRNPDAMSLARFVTHLRYLYARIDRGTQLEAAPPRLIAAMRETYPELEPVSRRVQELFAREGHVLGEAEVCYLEIHIARLSEADARAGSPSA